MNEQMKRTGLQVSGVIDRSGLSDEDGAMLMIYLAAAAALHLGWGPLQARAVFMRAMELVPTEGAGS